MSFCAESSLTDNCAAVRQEQLTVYRGIEVYCFGFAFGSRKLFVCQNEAGGGEKTMGKKWSFKLDMHASHQCDTGQVTHLHSDALS